LPVITDRPRSILEVPDAKMPNDPLLLIVLLSIETVSGATPEFAKIPAVLFLLAMLLDIARTVEPLLGLVVKMSIPF